MIDLHIHSTASDGSHPPVDILKNAVGKGLYAISITDHDTIDGVRQAIEAGIPPSIEFISGVEISAAPMPGTPKRGSLHILGYGFSIYDPDITTTLETLRDARKNRNPRIVEKLNQIGFPLTLAEVEEFSGQGQTGRPHIAGVMVKKGYVASIDEAFDNYLSEDKPAYVDKFRISCADALKLIRNAGGIAVLAHPGFIETTPDYPIRDLVRDLADLGLGGIEVHYTDHTAEQTAFFEALARDFNLLVTGGTDFHGRLKPGIDIGTGSGDLLIPDHLFSTLTEAVESLQTREQPITSLEKNLGIAFNDMDLLSNALRHSSYVNEHHDKSLKDNQRFEFLGDAVLGLAVGQMLMEEHPDMNEGSLSKLRAALVSEAGLAVMARRLDLGRYIFLGKGERLSRGAEKNSILADTFEAVIAAVYLDQGFERTFDLIKEHFRHPENKDHVCLDTDDYKSLLQEYVQEKGNGAPVYEISNESGPDHDKTFEISVSACCITATGSGKSKKAAEQNAAQKALKLLCGNTP